MVRLTGGKAKRTPLQSGDPIPVYNIAADMYATPVEFAEFANSYWYGATVFPLGKYVSPNTGSDVTTAFQAGLDAAGAVATSTGYPVIIPVPPGLYKITQLDSPDNVFWQDMGATLQSSTTDATRAVVNIGSGTQNWYGKFVMPNLVHVNPLTHKYDNAGEYTFAGYCFKNVSASWIDFRQIFGFYIGAQALGISASYAGHNVFNGGNILDCKIGVDFRGYTAGANGWVNENRLHKTNIQAGSNLINFGAAWGVRFSYLAGGYSGQTNNTFDSVAFQMGVPGTSFTVYATGQTIVAGYRRAGTNGYEYMALNGGTTNSTQPTGTTVGGTETINGITWQCMGPFFRTPFKFDNAGGQIKCDMCRWEGGYGPAVHYLGTTYNDGNSFEFYEKVNVTANPLCPTDIYDAQTTTTAGQAKIRNMVKTYFEPGDSDRGIDDIHMRAIYGTNGWTVAGLEWRDVTVLSESAITDSVAGATSCILCRDTLMVQTSGNGVSLGCVVDTKNLKRFRVEPDSYDDAGRITWTPLDDSFIPMDLETTGVINSTNLVVTERSTLQSGYETGRTGSDTHSPLTVAAASSVPGVWIGFVSLNIKGFRIRHIQDQIRTTAQPISCLLKSGNFGDYRRRSKGTPTYGFFMQVGECIPNGSYAAGQPKYWIVQTAGILAPAFAAGSVIKGELRYNAAVGRVYAANSSGTYGGTPPTGTGTALSDGGSVTWDYLAPVAVLEAVYGRSEGQESLGNQSGSYTVNFDTGFVDNKTLVLTGTSTLTLSATRPGNYILAVRSDAAASRSITWSTTINGATPPASVSDTVGKLMRLYFDSTNWFLS